MAQTSILLATYNGEKFIEEQIRSLFGQKLLPLELVISDDGSTDRTVEIINQLAVASPFPIRIYRNKHKKGFRKNFVDGALLCEGKLIAFCDQDDVWHPNKLAIMESAMARDDILLAYHNAEIVTSSRFPTGLLYGPQGAAKKCESKIIDIWHNSLGFTQIFRSELCNFNKYHKMGADHLFTQENFAHDQWYFLLANCFGKTLYVNDCLVHYRQHESNVFGAASRRRIQRIDAIRATIAHSHVQTTNRMLTIKSVQNIMSSIETDAQFESSIRKRAGVLFIHFRLLECYYISRLSVYLPNYFVGRLSKWIDISWNARKRYRGEISILLNHLLRDLLCGVVFRATPGIRSTK